jgi:hypothetical protein
MTFALHYTAMAHSIIASLSSLFHSVRLSAFVLYWMWLSFNHLMRFMLPQSVYILLQRGCHDLFCICGHVLLKFHNFLEPKGCFTLKIYIPTFVFLIFMIVLHDNVPN